MICKCYYCSGLTSVTIPNSVTNIGSEAFQGCSGLTSITIPNSVTNIGDYAFYLCRALSSIVVNENNTEYDSRDNCNAIIDTKTNTLVMGCKNTIIPEGVTSIGEKAFAYCRGLTSVTIPESVKSIGGGAFAGCSGLTSVTIPENVTSIGENAFSGCSSLTSVTVMQETPPVFHPFSNKTNVMLYVPYSCKAKYAVADYWKDFKEIEEMEIPPVTSIALNKTTLTITEGDNDTLSVTCTPTYADGRSVTWTTSNANVATVDAQGKVTAIAEGVVIVTATTTNGKTAQCVVNVKKDTVNISFADPNVKTACVENWDTDGNGKLSYDEAAAVSSIGEVFRDKKNITSFEELRYFTV